MCSLPVCHIMMVCLEGYWLKAVSYLACRKCVANFRISPLVSSHGGYSYDPKISRECHTRLDNLYEKRSISITWVEWNVPIRYPPPCSTMLTPCHRLLSNCIRRQCARGLRVATLWDHGLGMNDLRESLVRFWFMAKDCHVIPEAFNA